MVQRVPRDLRPEELASIRETLARGAHAMQQSLEVARAVANPRRALLPGAVVALALASGVMLVRVATTLHGPAFVVAMLSATICALLLVWGAMSVVRTLGARDWRRQCEQAARVAKERSEVLASSATEVSFVVRRAWNLFVGESDPNCDFWVVLLELEGGQYLLTHMPGIADLTNQNFPAAETIRAQATLIVLASGETFITQRWDGARVEMTRVMGFHRAAFLAWYDATARQLADQGMHGSFLISSRDDLPMWVRARLDAK
jgi:hypothetical protein